MLLLAVTAAVLAVPAVASANWTQESKELGGLQWTQEGSALGSEGSMSLSGTLKLSGSLMTLSCPITTNVDLSPGNSGTASGTSVSAAGCGAIEAGTVKALCGKEGKVTSVTPVSQPWGVVASEAGGKPALTINGGKLLYKFAYPDGKACVEFTLTGNLTATPENAEAIGASTISGSMVTGSNTVSASGTLNATPAGKYGVTSKKFVAMPARLASKAPKGRPNARSAAPWRSNRAAKARSPG
jgi:hypothetical protein